MKTGLAEAGHSFLYGTVEKTSALNVSLDIRGSPDSIKGSGGEEVDRHNDIFRGRHRGAEIKVSYIGRAEVSIFRDGGVEEDFEDGEGAGGGRYRIVDKTSIPPPRTPGPPNNSPVLPLFPGHRVVVGGLFGTGKNGAEGGGSRDKFDKLNVIGGEPFGSVGARKGRLHGEGLAKDIEVEDSRRGERRGSTRVGGVRICSRGGTVRVSTR